MGKRIFVVAIVVVTALLIVGCASIVSKSMYPVSISSDPDGVDITIENRIGQTVFSGKTPVTVKLDADAGFFQGEDYTITFTKDGYEPKTTMIDRGVDGWYILGNILIGGLIGWVIVDPLTGAMWTLEPNVHANLNQKSALLEQMKTLNIVDSHTLR